MKNYEGIDFPTVGNLQLEGKSFVIIKLDHVKYVQGFLTKYIVVPAKSLSKDMEPNEE